MHISLDSALGQQRRLNSVGESITQIAPDPAAAYSLRSLTGGDPKVVRVRRASDNHEQDFTASDVSSGALQDFVNAQVTAPLDIQALSATGRDGDFLIAKAAYSLRSLGTRQATLAATGDTVARANGQFVVQVRRSSDDALKSFTADEITDGTLLSFVGTSGSDNGFVKTWYDQSVTTQAGDTATGNHAVQATAAEQPKIVDSGSLIADGIEFDGSDDTLTASSVSGFGATISMFEASIRDSGGAAALSMGSSASTNNTNFGIVEGASVSQASVRNTTSRTVNASVSGSTRLSFAVTTGQTSTKVGALGGTLVETTDDYGSDFTSGELDTIFLGKLRAGSGTTFNGHIREAIIYDTDQSDNRVAIEANIGEAYSIDLPSGVDPGFDQVDGFVETWYDQSGNGNDVTQSTASKQPKIVNAGSLVTVNSKASFKFDGTDDFLERETYTQGTLSQPNTFFSVAELDVYADENRKLYDGHLNTARNMFQLSTTGSGQFAHFAGTVVATGENADADRHLFTSLLNGASSSLRIDGTEKTTGNPSTQGMTGIVIGANHDTANNFWDGDIQEIIIYNSNQTSNFTALETNVNSHYSIF